MMFSSGQKKDKGFTLIEVMVALAIVALSVSALLLSTSTQIDNSAWLREKTFAQWVALNVLQETQLTARVTNRFPDQSSNGETTLANRQWFWELILVETNDENILRLDVSVSSSEDKSSTLATATGFIDKYHYVDIATSTNKLTNDNDNSSDISTSESDDNSINQPTNRTEHSESINKVTK